MLAFSPLAKGALDLQDKYNSDFGAVHAELANKADAKPPLEYDLPLAPNLTLLFRCFYSKDPFGYVDVHLVATVTGALPSSGVVAALPEGFYPGQFIEVTGSCGTASERLACTFMIHPNYAAGPGSIQVKHTAPSPIQTLYMAARFQAYYRK